MHGVFKSAQFVSAIGNLIVSEIAIGDAFSDTQGLQKRSNDKASNNPGCKGTYNQRDNQADDEQVSRLRKVLQAQGCLIFCELISSGEQYFDVFGNISLRLGDLCLSIRKLLHGTLISLQRRVYTLKRLCRQP